MTNKSINRAVQRALAATKECKQVTSRQALPVGNSATIYAVHDDIALGASSDERVGNRIKMKQFRMHMNVQKAVPASLTTCRVLLIESKLAEPLFATDILTTDNVDATYSLQLLSTGDLRVVIDEFFHLDQYHPYWTKSFSKRVSEYVQWRGDTSSAASQAGGGLYLFLISDAVTNAPTFVYESSLCYID